MVNPTGKNIRNDPAGSGYYGSPRGNRKHSGTDFEVTPGQAVLCPISGKIKRIIQVYSDDTLYKGVEIENANITIKMFYVIVDNGFIGKTISRGEYIGKAQNVSMRYPGQKMKPHVHLEIAKCNPMLFIGMP